jgi:hypothetical protein
VYGNPLDFNPIGSADVIDFDFDSFLHDGDTDTTNFDFNGPNFTMENEGIGADWILPLLDASNASVARSTTEA